MARGLTETGYAPEKIQYGIDRYQNETRRLYRVLDTQLSKSTSGYLVGDKCTIADLSCWGWVAAGCEFASHHPLERHIANEGIA